jgi:protein phosphatase
MGTTLTAVNLIGNNLFVGHVGDSRAYLIRDKKASLITNDHTRVGELVRMKILTKDKIRTHSQRSVLDKCLGFNLFVQPDIFRLSVKNDDIIILCTDGVWAVIEDDEFAELANSTPDPENLSREIGELALRRDHDDNLTAVVIRLNQISETDSNVEPKGSWLLPRLFNRFVR